jgi:alpha-1,6-mannosyltransferase
LTAAAKNRTVLRGFIGTFCIAVGALSPAYLPRSSPFWKMLDAINLAGTTGKITGTVATMVGVLLLVTAWFSLRPRHNEDGGFDHLAVKHWAVLVLWSLPFLAAPPIFSHDAYSYAAQGWMWHNNINPYDVGPGILPGAFADQVAWVWRTTRAPYGPLALEMNYWTVVLCGFHPYLSAVMMRVPAVLGTALVAHLLPRIGRQQSVDAGFVAWFGVLNPLVLINFIGGCHNDALMMGFMVAGLWLAGWRVPDNWVRTRKRLAFMDLWWWVLGAVLIGLAAAIKQPAIMAAAALPLLPRPWTSWTRRELGVTFVRVLASLGIATGTFALVSVITGLGFGWIFAIDVPGQAFTAAPFNLLGAVLNWTVAQFGLVGVDLVPICRTIGVVTAGVIIAWLWFAHAGRRPYVFLSYGFIAVAAGFPALHTWYLQWGGTLLPLAMRRRTITISVWATLVLLGFDAINMSWRNNAIALGIGTAVAVIWFAWNHTQEHALAVEAVETAATSETPAED